MTAPRRVTPDATLVLPADADHEEWLRARQSMVCSSDVADILGVGYSSARHVYYQKRGDLPLESDAGEAAMWGHLHEETVAREWARRNKSTVRRVGLVQNIAQPWMGTTLDRVVPLASCPLQHNLVDAPGARCCLEVKTRSAYKASQWATGIPDDVHAQGLWALMTTGFHHIHIACLIGGNDYRQYTVHRDAELQERVLAPVTYFWHVNVVKGLVPDFQESVDPDRYVELEARLHPNREGTRHLSDADALAAYELMRSYQLSHRVSAAHDASKKRDKAKLIELLHGGDSAVVDNELLFTYDERNAQRSVDWEKLAERYPDAYRECVTQPKTRAISIKWKGDK